ncbi:hypothetical protein [Candidatus Alkanophaga liquidiphilum]
MTEDLNGDGVFEAVSDVMDGGDCILIILRGSDGFVEWRSVLAYVSDRRLDVFGACLLAT